MGAVGYVRAVWRMQKGAKARLNWKLVGPSEFVCLLASTRAGHASFLPAVPCFVSFATIPIWQSLQPSSSVISLVGSSRVIQSTLFLGEKSITSAQDSHPRSRRGPFRKPSSHVAAEQPSLHCDNVFFTCPHIALSAQPSSLSLVVPDRKLLLPLDTIIPDHPRVLPDILALDLETSLRLLGLEQEVVVAVRAVLVALFKRLHVFAETLLALFAGEDHLRGAFELVVLLLGVAFCAVEPLPAAGGADGDLGVEDVFA